MVHHWIGGKNTRSEIGDRFTTVSPAHDTTVGDYALGTASDIDKAVQAARTAFDAGPWPRMSGQERASILNATADLIDTHSDDLARLETLESGKPITQANSRNECSGRSVALCGDASPPHHWRSLQQPRRM